MRRERSDEEGRSEWLGGGEVSGEEGEELVVRRGGVRNISCKC